MSDDVHRHKRLDVELSLSWSIDGQGVQGSGKLLDVSLPGACFRIEQPFSADRGLTFVLESKDVPAMPKRGRLRWYRRLPGRDPKFLCGVIFDKCDDPAWVQWLEAALSTPETEKIPA